jgi:hypothetical protein
MIKAIQTSDKQLMDEYRYWQEMYYRERDIHIQDNNYYMLAMKLTGCPDIYLDRAMKMINRHGFLKALKLTRPRARIKK